MPITYKTNPWNIPELADIPIWPFHDIDFWHLGNIIQEIGVREEDFPHGITFHPKNKTQLRIRDAFLCSGILMSPSVYNGGPQAWGFFLEHIDSLRASSGLLRIQANCIYWEERVRTIFAERFALGLSGWLLWKSYDVLHIADAGPFISKTLNDPSSPYHRKSLQSLQLYGANGGYKPDLFCLTNRGECVIAESKGAIGPPSKLISAKKKGKNQVSNVNPVGVPIRSDGGRLVFASNFRHEGENPRVGKESCITVVDPEENNEVFNVQVTEDEIVTHSYCKILSLCGHIHLANHLLKGRSIESDHIMEQQIIEIGGRKILPLLQRKGQIIGIQKNIAQILFQNKKGLAKRINNRLKELEISSLKSNDSFLILPNGIIYGNRY